MGIRVRHGIERNPFTGEERDVEIPCLGMVCRDGERERGETLVSDLVEQVQFVLDQYGDRVPAEDVRGVHAAIQRLQEHDRNADDRLAMLTRRLGNLRLRMAEAEKLGQLDRPDIHWVRSEISALEWALRRV